MANQNPRRTGYTSNPGNAPIVRQGHTTDGEQGSDPTMGEVPENPVRDLRPTS